jgi:hypothetical protein
MPLSTLPVRPQYGRCTPGVWRGPVIAPDAALQRIAHALGVPGVRREKLLQRANGRLAGECDGLDTLARQAAEQATPVGDQGTPRLKTRETTAKRLSQRRKRRPQRGNLLRSHAEQSAEAKYSPPKINGAKKTPVIELPAREHISTSHVERHNLTNAHSKKIENHEHAMALFFMFYNSCRVHGAIRTSPAAASGLADHVWTLDEFIGLLR